ncbi:MAG: divalent-cation tolerance protein CutA [Patescibacteria group bacterium]
MKMLYTVCVNQTEAKKISKGLIKKRLAACVNSWPIHSTYCWQGKLVEEREVALLAKTLPRKVTAAARYIKAEHSEKIPAIISWSAKAENKDYNKWINVSIS